MNTKYRSIQIQSACIVLLLSLPLWSQDNFKPVPESLLIPQDQFVTIFLTNSVSLENYLIVQTGDVWILKSTNLKTQEFPVREIFRVV
ncbi:MAG: hypothetical protein IID15_07890, partial [Candidatus Marinimicrobia bacterium]|nr:hypothetical protein [Candidatus Neomarinimicrobiota bacterium]